MAHDIYENVLETFILFGKSRLQGSFLLKWINFNPSMDK